MSEKTSLPTDTLQIQFLVEGKPVIIAQRSFTADDAIDWGDWARRMIELGHRMLDSEALGHEVLCVRDDHEDFVPGLSYLSSARPHWVIPTEAPAKTGEEAGP